MPKLRPVPWMMALELAMIAREHWSELPERDRRELQRLITKSKGRPGNLTPRERAELRAIAGRLDVPGMGKRLLPVVGKHRTRRHRGGLF